MLKEEREVTKDMQGTISSSQKGVKEEAREIFHVMGQILLYIFYVAVDNFCTHKMSYLKPQENSVMRLNISDNFPFIFVIFFTLNKLKLNFHHNVASTQDH